MRRILTAIAFIAAVGACWYFWPGQARREPSPAAGKSLTEVMAKALVKTSVNAASPETPPTKKSPALQAESTSPANAGPYNEADFPLAARLNAPNSTVAGDLDALRQIFEAWQTNFPHDGNPIGENPEITAALMGDNRLGIVLIPKGHRAVNEQGELCDRWGTPLRFHQLSGTKMEIRSAGPDRKFTTGDDVVLTPP